MHSSNRKQVGGSECKMRLRLNQHSQNPLHAHEHNFTWILATLRQTKRKRAS